MRKPYWTRTLFLASLALAVSLPLSQSQAELVDEEVEADAITPEGGNLQQETLVLKKRLPVKAKKTKAPPVQYVYEEENAYEPVSSAPQAVARAEAVATAGAPKASVGSALDQGVQTKMDDVRVQFENALLKTLDRIKITVDDGTAQSASNSASVTANNNAGPVNTSIIQDNVVQAQAAPAAGTYMPIEAAPAVAVDEDSDGESVAEYEEEDSSAMDRVRLAPVVGVSNINSSYYDISSGTTLGVSMEVDVAENLAAVLGYTYAKYDIGLATGNSFYNYYQPFGRTQTLQYHQNIFDAGLRFYVFPRTSKFSLFAGAGGGYNKGYLNYKRSPYSFNFDPYANLEDYEVNSWIGNLETGAELAVSSNVAIGALFKYSTVLSSQENQRLSNYGFINNGYGYSQVTDKDIVGGSIAEDSFYSILGTVKISF